MFISFQLCHLIFFSPNQNKNRRQQQIISVIWEILDCKPALCTIWCIIGSHVVLHFVSFLSVCLYSPLFHWIFLEIFVHSIVLATNLMIFTHSKWIYRWKLVCFWISASQFSILMKSNETTFRHCLLCPQFEPRVVFGVLHFHLVCWLMWASKMTTA